MKPKLLLAFLLLPICALLPLENYQSSLISPLRSGESKKDIEMVIEKQGPFYTGKQIQITGKMVFNNGYLNDKNLNDYYLYIRCHALGRYSRTPYWYKRFYHNSNNEFEFLIDYKDSENLLSKGYRIFFEFKKDKEVIQSYGYVIYDRFNRNIDIAGVKDAPFLITGVFIQDNRVECDEKYDFQGYSDYVLVDKFNRFRFDDIYFSYYGYEEFLYENAYIKFVDKYEYFKNIPNDLEGNKILPVKLLKKEDKYKIYFESLYFDEYSLQMTSNEEGFKSSCLYLPRTDTSLIEDYEFEIIIEGAGYVITNFNYKFEVQKDDFILNDPFSIKIIGGVK
jgi:hypothetical protein